jgi:DNA topoisomerase-1
MAEHIELDPMAPEWTCAVAVRLINLAWFRVGEERYAKVRKTFGITTLRKSHVSVRGSRIPFAFAASTGSGSGPPSSTASSRTR